MDRQWSLVFDNYSLDTYYMLGIVLATGDTAADKKKIPITFIIFLQRY